MEQQSSPRTFRWLDKAIMLCVPALVVNFFVAVGIIAFFEQATLYRVFSALFMLILTGVGIILLIHYTDRATALISKALTEAQNRVVHWLAGLGRVFGCVLFVTMLLAGIWHIGVYSRGDAFLMSIEIPMVGTLFLERLRWWKAGRSARSERTRNE